MARIYLAAPSLDFNIGMDVEILRKLSQAHGETEIGTLFTDSMTNFDAVEEYCRRRGISINEGFNGNRSPTDKFLLVLSHLTRNRDETAFHLTHWQEYGTLAGLYSKSDLEFISLYE